MTEPRRPNILLVCTDQQRYDALGCYDNPHVQSPHVDRLAAEGVRFERCYVQSPVCAPSRASLLTGRYPRSHGLWANGVALPAHETLFPRALADAGYDTGMVGKLHLAACQDGRDEPRRDDGLRVLEWAHDPWHDNPGNAYHRWLEAYHPAVAAGARERGWNDALADVPASAHYSRWVGERGLEFLERGRDPGKPFFLWLNFFDPHHPFQIPREFLDRYDPAALPPPVGRPGELETKPPIQREASARSYAGNLPGFAEHSPDEIQRIKATYYAMVTSVDEQVGRVLARLEELGLERDTLVVFTSDHGEMLGDHGLLLKGPLFYEGAVRVPLILRWPGRLPRGERRLEIVQWLDLEATILAAAGLPPQARSQASSLFPLARGEAGASARGWAICEHRNSSHPYDPPVHATMLVRDRHKLVVYHGPPSTSRARAGELYDLAADPDELENLWDDPAHLGLRHELTAFLLDALVATEDRSQPREADW